MVHELFSAYKQRENATTTRMFGHDGIMVNGNVMMFEWKGAIVFRLGEADAAHAMKFPGAKFFSPMEGGKPSKGWVTIPANAVDNRILPIADAAYAFASALPPKPVKPAKASVRKEGRESKADAGSKKITKKPAPKVKAKKVAVKKVAKKAAKKVVKKAVKKSAGKAVTKVTQRKTKARKK
jgi:TfoX/Sxy family transcriptional regulator of competence genes